MTIDTIKRAVQEALDEHERRKNEPTQELEIALLKETESMFDLDN
jgi:hypothetical protein